VRRLQPLCRDGQASAANVVQTVAFGGIADQIAEKRLNVGSPVEERPLRAA